VTLSARLLSRLPALATGITGIKRGPRAPRAVALLLVLFLVALAPASLTRVQPHLFRVPRDPRAAELPLHAEEKLAQAQPPQLTPVTQPASPPPPAVALSQPLKPHEVFGFAPYWTLDQASGYDLRDLTTVAYFGVDLESDGSVSRAGTGWEGLQSQQLANLTSAAHAQGARVVLTAKTFDPAALHQLATNANAAVRLASDLTALIKDKSMDGANLDLEGTGGQDRVALAGAVSSIARELHAQNPHWQVTVDTYAGSAANNAGWFDIPRMADAVDAFFVMAYDMYQQGRASPNAPLNGYSFSDEEALASYVAAVPAHKVLLGVPFYGYDWATPDNQPNGHASSGPTPVTYAQLVAAGHPAYWDPTGQVPWTAYQENGQWHEIYYDDPASLSLKAQLANRYGILGLGIWALGMDGNNPGMMAALLGRSQPLKPGATGPGTRPPAPAATPGAPPATSSTPAPPRPSAKPSPAPQPSPRPSPSPSPSPSNGPVPPAPSPPPLPLPSPSSPI